MSKLNLEKLYNTDFPELYWKLLGNESEISEREFEILLSIAVFLVGLEDPILQNLGYRIFLLYSKITQDYKPLYELSLNKGLIPIAQFIDEKMGYGNRYGNIQTIINRLNNLKFKWEGSYRTLGQYKLHEKSYGSNRSQTIVAPTSYGKTELILSFIKDNFNKNICIITPTKSLLAQTKKRILNFFGYIKVVTHPEMYSCNDDQIIAVLTQERLSRLLQSNPDLKFDLLIVDEAHNILEKYSKENTRSIILASTIIICNKRNNNLILKYLTPFLKSEENIKLKYLDKSMEFYTVNENIKSEMIYFYDLDKNTLNILDQYSTLKDKLIKKSNLKLEKESSIVIKNGGKKNIIYLNTPKKLEKFAEELYDELELKQVEALNRAAKDLKEYVHEDYKLAEYITKGVIYHHGLIPELVRYYIEDLFINIPELKMLVANATLLEGVNIPATKMFILEPKRGRSYLSPSDFKNLIGRVCRFGEIFNEKEGNLDYLLPEIHIINGKYFPKNFNVDTFIQKRKILVKDQAKIKDEVLNPLLIETKADQINKDEAEVILENLSSKDIITKNYKHKPKTEIGKLCFENNVQIFNIFEVEPVLEEKLQSVTIAKNLEDVFRIMSLLFFSNISADNSKSSFDNLRRLNIKKAQIFYKMLIDWRISGFTFKEMVNSMVGYWEKLEGSQARQIFVGKWGDSTRGGKRKMWTDISQKTRLEKVNLAIVRIKEEFDFLDNELIKYIEILRSLRLIEEDLYLKIKYGTSDKEKIALLNEGISSTLSDLLFKKYKNFIEINTLNGSISFHEKLILEMQKNEENGVLISEAKLNSKE